MTKNSSRKCKLQACKNIYINVYNSETVCEVQQHVFAVFYPYVGLKQGDPSSPLLLMLFVNDMLQDINSHLDGIFSLNEIKLFLILFADDQVVFAKSPQSLPSLLNDIEHIATN